MTHPSIFETIERAASLHRDQFDKAGVPYIAHPLAVMRKVSGAAWHVAVLHDVMEDCDVTREDILGAGYTTEEADAIELLTRRDGETYEEFIERIALSGNALAVEVKMADITDNLDPSRLPIEDDGHRRETRYRCASARLLDAADVRSSR
jgi:(p)ppGpp synthase/HD superfamily hydrolase